MSLFFGMVPKYFSFREIWCLQHIHIYFCCCSVGQTCLTLCDPMDCLTQCNYEPRCVGPTKTDGSWWRVLTKCGLLEKSESEVAQLCLTLCDPMDCSLPVSSLHGILQARVLEWVAIPFTGMANHFSIPALRTPWPVWKGKKIWHWKLNPPGW